MRHRLACLDGHSYSYCSCLTPSLFNISQLESGEYFHDVLREHAETLLGPGRKDLGILVKLLDSSIRLPLQVHPNKAFSRKYLNSPYGKTEFWIIVGAQEDACIYFGFNGKYTTAQLWAAFEKDADTDFDMTAIAQHGLHCIPQRKGSVEHLITYEHTPCFGVNRYYADEKVLLPCPAVYVVSGGTGELTRNGQSRRIKKGDYFFAPASIDTQLFAHGTGLEITQCCLPQNP